MHADTEQFVSKIVDRLTILFVLIGTLMLGALLMWATKPEAARQPPLVASTVPAPVPTPTPAPVDHPAPRAVICPFCHQQFLVQVPQNGSTGELPDVKGQRRDAPKTGVLKPEQPLKHPSS